MALCLRAWSSSRPLERTLARLCLSWWQGESMSVSRDAYILSAVIGVLVCGGLLYFIGKKIAKD